MQNFIFLENDSNEVKCKTCSNSTVLQDGSCLQSCPSGTFKQPYINSCKKCPFKECLECDSSKCTKCKPLFEVQKGVCQSACGDGTYHNFKDQECTNCHHLCLSCKGPTKHDCSQCRKKALTLLKRDKKISCVESCPIGYFMEDNLCLPCDGKCATCATSGSCLSCNEPYILQQNQCLNNCDEEHFHDTKRRECIPCSNYGNCTKCAENICIECKSGASFLNGKCLNDCGRGFYSLDQKCLPCSGNFTNCDSCVETGCLECSIGYYVNDADNTCVVITTTTTTTTTTPTTTTIITSTTERQTTSTTTTTTDSSTILLPSEDKQERSYNSKHNRHRT